MILAAALAIVLSGRGAWAADRDSTGSWSHNALRNQTWAVGMLMRYATIPFATQDRDVETLVPLIFYEGETVYFTGLSGGIRVARSSDWRFSAITRMRFFDIPKNYQNVIQADQFMFGAQAEYARRGPWYLDLELMGDRHGNLFGNARTGTKWESPLWRIDGFVQLQPKSRSFNSRYYGLDSVSVPAGTELSVGFFADYQVWTNFFLYAAGSLSRLDRGVRDVPFVNRGFNSSLYLGLGLSEYESDATGPFLAPGSYLRAGYGWFTPSSLGQTMKGAAEKDTADNQMASIFYGHPLSNTLLTLPIDVYLHTGYVHHFPSDVQGTLHEFVIAIKILYTVPIPWRVRFGAAEGLSWINRTTFVEQSQIGAKGYSTSNLVNYLDFSVDLNLGDVLNHEPTRSWWIGYGIHHRSSIFEQVQYFGRIKGGSNVQTLNLTKSF